MSSRKRHHYLPEMYLAGFTDDGTRDGTFRVYHRKLNEVKPATPNNTGVIGHWYSITGEDGSRDSSIEDWLSGMETHAVPGLEKLRRGGEALSADERHAVATFIGFLWIRGPEHHALLEDVNQVLLDQLRDFRARRHSPAGGVVSHRELPDSGRTVSLSELEALEKDGRVRLPRSASIPTMMMLGKGITNFAVAGDWMVYRAAEGVSFVTTDNPVVAVPEALASQGLYPRAPLDFDVPKIVPLSSSALLAFSGKGGRHGEKSIEAEKVRTYNAILAYHAGDFVIGRDDGDLTSAVSSSRLSERGERTRIWPPPRRTEGDP